MCKGRFREVESREMSTHAAWKKGGDAKRAGHGGGGGIQVKTGICAGI